MTQPTAGPPGADATPPRRRIASALIVEDHPLFCDALSITLQIVGGINSVRTTSSINECVEQLRTESPPDVVFLDLNLPDAEGLDGLLRVKKAAGDAAILIVSSLTSPSIVAAALEYGASGYVPKHSQRHVFQAALDAIAAGRTYLPDGFVLSETGTARQGTPTKARLESLTPQQARILGLISDGKLNKQIAHELSIAESTVKAHVTVIMRKLGVQTRTQAVLAAQAARFDSLASR